MKKNRFLAFLLAIVAMVSLIAPTAYAISIVEEEATVYLDDKVKRVDAYLDDEGDIRVYSVDDLYKILPELKNEVFVLPSSEGYVIADYLEHLSYGHYTSGNKLYIYTDEEVINLEDILYPGNSKNVRVFVNGLYVETESVSVSDGKAFVENCNDIYKLFPNETKNTYFSTIKKASDLEIWTNKYKYTYIIDENNVYLNNNGQKPVKITVNGETVFFPDQQPKIVPPGRTMVPVHSISNLIGADITWDGKNNRVIIESDYNKLIIWIGNTTYWLNGTWHTMDVKPYVINGRTMVPVAFVCSAFGYIASFDGSANVDVVNLSSGW